MKTYIPRPIDLSDVMLTDDLSELREAIAKNAHDIWAQNRMAQGWTYGPERNDALKQTPDMVAYVDLPETEKHYDREMAMNTIRLLHKLGYDLLKHEDTELYRKMQLETKQSTHEYHCPCCNKMVYKHQIYCDGCGNQLEINWKD